MERRSEAERFFGWWISWELLDLGFGLREKRLTNAAPRRARPSGDTFSGMRILGRLGVEGGSWGSSGAIAEGAIVESKEIKAQLVSL